MINQREKIIGFTEKVSPLKASDLSMIFSDASISDKKFRDIITSAAQSVALLENQHLEWNTDEEQRLFNISRSVIGNTIKIVNRR